MDMTGIKGLTFKSKKEDKSVEAIICHLLFFELWDLGRKCV